MTPLVIVAVLGAGLIALLPTRRLAERSDARWVVAAYFLVLWIVIAGALLVPPVRRLAIPVALLLALAPWVTVRDGIDRLLGRPPREPRRPPRNVTPPDA